MGSLRFMSLVCLVVVASIAVALQSQITELTDDNFVEFAKPKDFLFVDFFAPWCSDSKALAPELDKAALILGRRSIDVVKVDCFGKGRKLCNEYNIKHWPTLKTFRRGVVTSEYEGAHRAEAVASYINGAEDIIQDNAFYAGYNGAIKMKTVAASAPAPAPVPVATPEMADELDEEDEGPGVETADTSVQLPGASESGKMVSTPEEVLPIAPAAVEVTTQSRPQSGVTVAQSITPSAETLNELECAKCRILTPAQRKTSASCKSFKRECIPNFNSNIQYSVNMVPGGAGKKRGSVHKAPSAAEKKRGRRYAHFVGLRK